MRAHAFSRHLTPPIDAHPAFLVFDQGPGRQGGRSTERLSTLLGRDRGRDEHRPTQPCQATLASASRSMRLEAGAQARDARQLAAAQGIHRDTWVVVSLSKRLLDSLESRLQFITEGARRSADIFGALA